MGHLVFLANSVVSIELTPWSLPCMELLGGRRALSNPTSLIVLLCQHLYSFLPKFGLLININNKL